MGVLKRQLALLASGAVPAGILAITTALLLAPGTTDEVRVAGARDDAIASAGAGAAAHEHAESDISYKELPRKTKAEVDQVIAAYATKYATGADAMKDGWYKATRSLYGIGAHYIHGGGFAAAASFDLLHPNILLFDGEGPDAKFAGVSYIVGGQIPEGFTGKHDFWHNHESVCLSGGTVVSLTEEGSDRWLSESECSAAGGRVLPLASDQMMHLWIGPDYINGAPIFAHDHPKLFNGYYPKHDGQVDI
jgi:hypothetical protein